MKYQKSSNGVANGLKAMAVIIICAGILYSLYLGAALGEAKSYFSNEREFSWPIAIGGCIVSVGISYGLFVAAEVLDLLQTSCDMEYKILCRLNGTEDTPDSIEHAAPTHEEMKNEPISSRKIPAAPTIQFCPHCGAKQSSTAAKCWHCGGTLSER